MPETRTTTVWEPHDAPNRWQEWLEKDALPVVQHRMVLGRKFIGIEREPKYFDIACKRIAHAVEQNKQRLFEPNHEPQPDQPDLGLDA